MKNSCGVYLPQYGIENVLPVWYVPEQYVGLCSYMLNFIIKFTCCIKPPIIPSCIIIIIIDTVLVVIFYCLTLRILPKTKKYIDLKLITSLLRTVDVRIFNRSAKQVRDIRLCPYIHTEALVYIENFKYQSTRDYVTQTTLLPNNPDNSDPLRASPWPCYIKS